MKGRLEIMSEKGNADIQTQCVQEQIVEKQEIKEQVIEKQVINVNYKTCDWKNAFLSLLIILTFVVFVPALFKFVMLYMKFLNSCVNKC